MVDCYRDGGLDVFRVHATTSSQEQAAAIALRLQEEEGLTSDYGTIEELRDYWVKLWPDAAHLLRTLHTYVVIVIEDDKPATGIGG